MAREGRPSIGPVTNAALSKSGRGKPPKMAEEFHQAVKEAGDYVLLWVGACRAGDGKGSFSWSSLTTSLGGVEPEAGRIAHQEVETPASHVERILSPLAHEARIRLLQILYSGPKSSSELSELTGLKGGNLHYHLKELMYADYVRESERQYRLTRLGTQLLITMTCIASLNVKDKGEDGLEISGGWEHEEGD
jgi:DNA-binding transcriptional ArsR family regulator